MNLHIAHDDKFLDYFIATQKVVTQSINQYIIYSEKELIHTRNKADVQVAKLYSQEFWELVGDLKQYKAVFIHYFNPYLAKFVLQIPKQIPIVWCFWGGDAFYLPKINKTTYLPQTKKYIQDNFPFLFPKMNWAWKPWNLYFEYKTYRNVTEYIRNHVKAIKRINYFAHYIKEDYEIIKENYPLRAKFIEFNYATVEDMVSNKDTISGNNTLLGNSAAASNNHIEAIDFLEKIDLNNSKVICPLSYSGHEGYIKYIQTIGEQKLGDAFIPLIDFIEKTQYNELLNSCQFAIMNHVRSQAAGNIVALLYKGSTLYMNSQSTLYYFLKSNGLLVRSVSELTENGLIPLTEEQIQINRINIQKIFGREVVETKYRNMFNLLEN